MRCGHFGGAVDKQLDPNFVVKLIKLPQAHQNPTERRRETNDGKKHANSSQNYSTCWKSLAKAFSHDNLQTDKLVQSLYDTGDATVAVPRQMRDNTSTEVPIHQLDLFECFFIFDVLGTINIYSGDKLIDSRKELWQLFKRAYSQGDENSFLLKYAAYFYFRSKGWVVKNGLKYGCDFVLYKDGPSYNHSLFCVTVLRVSFDGEVQTKLPPQYMNGIVRISKSVQKHPLICFVKFPRCEDVCDDSDLISDCTIRCVHVERWDPDSGLDQV